jgi:HSP20 family molecular chaperone IbpA
MPFLAPFLNKLNSQEPLHENPFFPRRHPIQHHFFPQIGSEDDFEVEGPQDSFIRRSHMPFPQGHFGGLLGGIHPMMMPMPQVNPFLQPAFQPQFHHPLFNSNPAPFFSHMSPMHLFASPQPHQIPFSMLNPASIPDDNTPFPILASILGSVVSQLPSQMHKLAQDQDSSVHHPMTLKLEAKDNYYVVSGWFPEIKKESLNLRLEGSKLFINGTLSTEEKEKNKDNKELAEFAEIDAVDEEIILPYAPNPQFFKAHFDETTHMLTIVFPKEQSVDVLLS